VKSQRAPQQPLGSHDIVEAQTVGGRVDQHLALAFHPYDRPKLGPAPATRLGAVQRGAAERTALNPSGLEIEQQILQLAACILQGNAVTAALGVADHLDQVDDFRPIFLAGFVELAARLR
jgi:hypothetical protein